jgi:predicted RNA-binding Zn-ribbon protein involved in translation (DUF1610 family)
MDHHEQQEAYGPDHRTFDCPWCGAISGIDPTHIGEHFECPECNQSTKLTPKNTRKRHITDPPKEAPHHEDRMLTFDCPWCGAISQVGSALLGTSFDCPECHQATRLTDQTTRAGDLFVPAADAPHHEESSGVGMKALIGLVVVAAIAWFAFGRGDGGSTETPDGGGRHTAQTPGPGEGPDEGPDQGPGTEEPAQPGTEDPEPPPSDVSEEPSVPVDVDRPFRVEQAQKRFQQAVQDHGSADKALRTWYRNNPLLREVLREQRARVDIQGALDRELAALQAPSPAALREVNARLQKFIEEEPARVLIVQQLLTSLKKDEFRPATVGRWASLNLSGPRFRELLGDRIQEGSLVIPDAHEALTTAVMAAKQELDAAKAAVEALGETPVLPEPPPPADTPADAPPPDAPPAPDAPPSDGGASAD